MSAVSFPPNPPPFNPQLKLPEVYSSMPPEKIEQARAFLSALSNALITDTSPNKWRSFERLYTPLFSAEEQLPGCLPLLGGSYLLLLTRIRAIEETWKDYDAEKSQHLLSKEANHLDSERQKKERQIEQRKNQYLGVFILLGLAEAGLGIVHQHASKLSQLPMQKTARTVAAITHALFLLLIPTFIAVGIARLTDRFDQYKTEPFNAQQHPYPEKEPFRFRMDQPTTVKEIFSDDVEFNNFRTYVNLLNTIFRKTD